MCKFSDIAGAASSTKLVPRGLQKSGQPNPGQGQGQDGVGQGQAQTPTQNNGGGESNWGGRKY